MQHRECANFTPTTTGTGQCSKHNRTVGTYVDGCEDATAVKFEVGYEPEAKPDSPYGDAKPPDGEAG
jgi:hypothetical protein